MKEGNVMADANGIIHLPLYGAAFIEPPDIPDTGRTDIGKLNE